MEVSSRPRSRLGGRHLILGIAGLYLVLAIWWALRPLLGGTVSATNLYIALFIAGPAFAHLYWGLVLPRTDIARDQYTTVARASLAAIGLMALVLGLYDLQPDGSLTNPVGTVLVLTALASVAGLSAGIYDARAKTRALELEDRNRELRQAQQQLTAILGEVQRTNEQLDEFASVVSHDLRNPLRVAEGRLELARRECDSEHFEPVAKAHDRMDVLITDLLTLARDGNQVSEREPVDLAALARECWQAIDTADATLVTDVDVTVLADRSRLRQLLENLVRNAVEHGGADVTITVGDLDDGFFVEDDGPGIQTDSHDEIFETGYSSAAEGTGFGLSIVLQIVSAHGWDIRPTEGSQGGARFEITGVEIVDGDGDQ